MGCHFLSLINLLNFFILIKTMKRCLSLSLWLSGNSCYPTLCILLTVCLFVMILSLSHSLSLSLYLSLALLVSPSLLMTICLSMSVYLFLSLLCLPTFLGQSFCLSVFLSQFSNNSFLFRSFLSLFYFLLLSVSFSLSLKIVLMNVENNCQAF